MLGWWLLMQELQQPNLTSRLAEGLSYRNAENYVHISDKDTSHPDQRGVRGCREE
jgi:hypothetical protein